MTLLNTLGSAQLPIALHSGEGPLLWDKQGKMYWDFYGGHAVTLIGNSHPKLVDAITDQARLLTFCTTISELPIRQRAAEKLCEFTEMDVAWFVNSGAEANEGALKMARKHTGRQTIVAMKKGFHGRTMGALGATWKYRDAHAPVHGETRFVPFGDSAALKAALDDTVAAVILEPIQGVSGIIEPPTGYLQEVAELCQQNGSLLICDEVQSGMGRAGVPLLSKAMGVDADLITLGKGLAGGFPAAAVLMNQVIADGIKPGEHGSTFGGGPLACAAILSTLEIIESENLLQQALETEQRLRHHLNLEGVVEIRGRGAWIGVELCCPAKPIARALLEKGIFVGTTGQPNTLRLAPPASMPECGVLLLKQHLKELLRPALVQLRGAA